MKAVLHIVGRITKGETLIDVIRQYKSFDTPEVVEVNIESNGGSKDEGDAIYDYLKNIDAETPVTTKTGKAYSIAAKIFAAGSTRIIKDTDEALMIHFASAQAQGTAEELELVVAELKSIKKEFVNFYSEHLDIDKDTVTSLLDSETFISGEEAVALGFATEVESAVEIVAELNIDNSKIDKMNTKKGNKSKLTQFIVDAEAFLKGLGSAEAVAELTLQDSSATDIVFPDLEETDTPKVGDKATVDGAAIPDGSHVMPSVEDSTFVFVDGEVSEIIPKEDEVEETDAEKEARIKAEKEAEVVAEDLKEVFTYTVSSPNTSFEEGETLMFDGWDGGDPYPASAGEFILKDGSSVVTDASGVIVSKKAKEADQVIDTEANFEQILEKVTAKVTDKITAEFDAKLAEKDKEITVLKKKQVSKEFNAEHNDDTTPKVIEGAGKYLHAARELNK